ncbi:MAG TPA: D-amino acid dehydrogenase [Syntrophobacteraceae bacterium]|nr:D-amino acid dehydrogenase [Syntrophobacteraceae bacterium]
MSAFDEARQALDAEPAPGHFDAIVLGAGITGITTAYFLAKEGRKVLVIDRRSNAALETTYANGGQISVSHAEPWAHPGAPLQVLKWLALKESPLYFTPRLDWRQWLWLGEWLWQCRRSAADRNTIQIVNIALRSRELYRKVRKAEGIEYAHKSLGILHFYRLRQELDNACRVAELMTRYGCVRRPVTKDAIDRIEPALADNREIIGGIFTEEDESGDARRFTQALAKICGTKYGVQFLYRTRIDDLVLSGGQIREVRVTGLSDGLKSSSSARDFILCLGPYSPLMAQRLGIFLNIYPAKGYSMSVPLDETNESFAPKVSLTDDENKLVFSNLETHLRIAGTAELAGWNTSLPYHRVKPIVEKSVELFPKVFSKMSYGNPNWVMRHLNAWTGLRPATPSNVPYVGRSAQVRNLWLNTGHGTLGWTMGMGTAEMLAKMLK